MRGFSRTLWTLLSLRASLWLRRLRVLPLITRLLAYATPLLLVAMAAASWSWAGAVAEQVHPKVTAVGMAGAIAFVHMTLFMEALFTAANQDQGLAPALFHFPLSPRVIYASETLVGATRPILMAVCAALLAASLHLGPTPPLAFLWMLAAPLYLMGLRQLLRLLLTSLLRKRWMRELVLALGSLLGLGFWFLWFSFRGQLGLGDPMAWVERLPAAFWLAPFNWFAVPFLAAEDIGALPRSLAVAGVPLLLLAVYTLGGILQDRVCHGEMEGLLRRDAATVARPRIARWVDHFPASLLHPSIWATAAKELRTLRRDPFLLTMLLSQGAVLLLPPFFIMGGLGGGLGEVDGGSYMPFFVMLLAVAEHAPVFNQIALEGRALRFLAQTPALRWRILLGKNLAFAGLYAPFNLIFLVLASWFFDSWAALPLYLACAAVLLVSLLAVGNVASAFLPSPWMGAGAAKGGARGAQAASEGGVERPGCIHGLLRFLLLQGSFLLALPPIAAIASASLWASGLGWLALGVAVLSYLSLLWIVCTLLAASQLERAEEKLLAYLASRGAA